LKDDPVKIISSIVIGAGIFIVYFVFLARCVALNDWSYLSTLEEVVLVTQVIRLLFVLSLGRVLKLPPILPMILFSLEVFMIPLLAVMAYWTGDPTYTNLMGAVLTTWIGVSSLVLSPYAVYEFTKTMMKQSSLANVAIVGTLEVGGLFILSEILSSAQSKILGPSALGALFISGSRSKTVIQFGGLGSNLILDAGLVFFFIGMVVHLGLRDNKTRSQILLSYALLLPLVGTLLSLIWVIGMSFVSSDLLFVFTVPVLVALSAVWVSSRGK
jgi:hypothetical protein